VNGAAWNFSDWPAGQPDNGFGAETVMHLITNIACGNSGAGRFINDLRPDFSAMGSCEQLPTSFVTEWSADCNDDGIVDYGQCRDGSLSDYNGNNVPDCCESGVPCTVGNYPVQWRVEDGGNGHWYQGRRLPTRITWADALDLARSTGGDLASLGSAAELESVFRRVASRVDLWSNDYSPPFIVGPWIGGRGVNGVWSWTDGSSWGFTNWYPGEGVPSSVEQYVHLYSGIGTQINPSPRWADFWAEPMSRSFLVEWAADCNDDGIVDYGQILNGTFADTNENGVPDSCEIDPCPGDITENGLVDGVDLSLVLSLWGTNGQKFPRSDTNADGTVDATDLSVVLAGWGKCP
jgi:hypothetical protein